MRSSIKVAHPSHVAKIAAIALRDECPAWHAASIFYDRLDYCMCAPCVRARAKRAAAGSEFNRGG